MLKIVHVRLKYGGQITVHNCSGLDIAINDWVVVQSNDLTYLGLVTTSPIVWPENHEPNEKINTFFNNQKILRIARQEDLVKQTEIERREKEAFEYCQARAKHYGLEMKLVAVEITFDESKVIFYYTADERVDFRLLVKDLVSRFRNRIEMRQISVRHETKMLGGLGACGQKFCCTGFLGNFIPVSVKMAKEQNLSLNPLKISGICGRLMCCLAYEHVESNEDDSEESFEDSLTEENITNSN